MAAKKKAKNGQTDNRLIVDVVHDGDGYTFSLNPSTSRRIHEMNPSITLPDRIFVAFEVRDDFEKVYGPIINQLIPILMGLDTKKIKELGEVWMYDPWRGQMRGQWHLDHP